MAEAPRKDWQEERGGQIDQLPQPQHAPLDNDDRIDEAIAESFPASDPPSFARRRGEARGEGVRLRTR